MSKYLWGLYCDTENQQVTVVADTEPTTCPNNVAHTIDLNSVIVLQTLFTEIISPSYVLIQSQLSGATGISIAATSPGGGIQITGGTAGTLISTTGDQKQIAPNILLSATSFVNVTGTLTRALTTTAYSPGSITATIGQIIGGLLTMTPTLAATITLPTAALVVAGLKNPIIGTSFTFIVQNNSTLVGITVAAGAGGTSTGSMNVSATLATSVGFFTIVLTNVSSGTEAYSLLRM